MTSDQLHCHLTAYLAHRSARPSVPARGPLTALKGGWASSLYAFTQQATELNGAAARTLVLKLYVPTRQGREHATREWHALRQLRGADYPVPQGILFEPDARPLGSPFIVMDYVPATSLWHVFEVADAGRQAALTQAFVTQLLALQALDPRILQPTASSRDPYSYLDHELALLRRDSEDSPHVMLPRVVDWLEQGKESVPCERPAILHRDYHPWNVLVDADEQLWVIDWDWQIGDPRFDLAWTCMLMERSGFHSFSSDVEDEYERLGGRGAEGLGYFKVLTTVRWLLNVLPPEDPDVPVDDAARAEFRAFLIDPVRRAQTFLAERTGVDVRVEL